MSNFLRRVLTTAGGILLATTLAAQRGPDELPAGGTTVPMLDIGGRPVVEVSVNGNGPFRMILDTGASFTVVNPEWIGGATGPTTLKELRIGTFARHDMPVGSQLLFGGNTPAEFPRGVLSALAFPGYLVTLDYVAKTVSIRKGALPAANGTRVFQYGADEVLPVVPVRVAGREFHLHLDSGSPGGVMLPLRFSKELPLAAELTTAGTARTVAGAFDVFRAPVKGAIELGEFTIDVPSVRFSDLRPGPEPGPGNIGFEALRTFRVTLDSANRRLEFAR